MMLMHSPSPEPRPTDTALLELEDWLLDCALRDVSIRELVGGLVERLIAAGIPVARFNIGFDTLHPLYEGVGYTWRQETGIDEVVFTELMGDDDPKWKNSPFNWLYQKRLPTMRRRLAGDGALLDFPLFEEFAASGGTDYLGAMVPFVTDAESAIGTNEIFMSFMTKRAGGFTDADLTGLRTLLRSIAVACKMRISHQETRTILSTYLGLGAGREVRDGRIKRGDGKKVEAVIWFSDLRGSVGLGRGISEEAYLNEINAYFDCAGGAVLDAGGEILRFVGDAALAVFPIPDGDVPEICRRALGAVKEAERRLAALNAQRQAAGRPPFRQGVGLHVGTVLYGNVGVGSRLEFTVIGSAANEAARIADAAKGCERVLMVSEPFARHGGDFLVRIGEFELKGYEKPFTLYAPVDEDRNPPRETSR
jgi:adenylate cyclase